MAEIKLVFKPDYSEVSKAIAAIKNDISKSIGNVKITIDSSGAQSVQKMATGLRDVATQAGRLDKEYGTLMRSTTTVDKATGDLIQRTKEYQKTALTAFKTVEDAQGNVTESEIKNYKELDKIAQKQADDFVKLKRYVFEQYRKWDEEDAKEAEAKRQKELEAERKATEEKNKLKLQMSRFNREQDEKDAAEAEKQAQRQAAAQKKAEDQVVSLRREYANFIRQIEVLKAQYPEGTFDEIEKEAREAQRELQNLDSTSKTLVGDVDRLSSGLKKEKAQFAEVREETNKLDKVTESFWMNIQKFARWYIGGNIVTKVIGSLREALATMKAVDTELANIQKVTDRTDQQMQRTAEAAYKVASAYGVAAQDYLESVAEFAKAGFGDQSEQLAEIATKTQLVGDVTSTIANKFLIASNAAWKMNGDVEALNKTLDAANIIENNYATSIEKLAAGMPIVSSIAAQAGMTFEETIAALGTITSVTQETGTKAATALRALILNIIGAVGEYEDGLEITEESVKSLDGILQVYAKDALAAADAAGTVVNPMEAIAALAKASEEGLVNQAELFEVLSSLGGKLRTNQLTALVQNFDMMQEMLDKTKESAGSADKEIGVMLDTWEAKTNILKNTWTEFIANTINSNFIKSILDISTAVVDFADNAGLAAAAAAGLFTIFKGKEVIGALKDVRDTFKNLGDVLKGTTSNMTAATTSIGLMITAVSAFIMIYRQVEQARRESLEKAATEAASIQNLTDKYDDLTEKLGSENLSRDELITLLKKSTEKYNEEWESINDVNELREIAIGLINEESKAKAKQYTIDNQAAYRMSQNILSGDRKVNMDYGGINQQFSYEEAIAFYEKAIDNAMKAENMTNAQARALGVLTDEYKRLKKEYEEATTTVEAYETALSILDGTYQKVEESGSRVAGRTKDLNNEQDNAAPKVKTLTERMAEASEAATKYDTAIGEVITAMTDFGAGSIEVYNAMVKLEAEIPGSTDKLYDFNTATWKIVASMIASKADLLDFIDTQKQLEFSSAIAELESVAAAYWDIAGAAVAAMTNQQAQAQMAGVLAMTGGGASQAHYDIVQSQLAGVKAQKAEWDAYIATLRARSGYRDDGSGNTTDEELARLQSIVELRKAELAFLQASGASTEEIVAKYKEIQNALHDENERRRAIRAEMEAQGATEEELAEIDAQILATGTEWWNVQKNINDALAETGEKTVDELERLESIVSLRKAELQFLEASGASEDEINAKRKEIQAALHEEAEYKRQIRAEMEAQGASEAELAKIDAEILALSTEWWEIQKDILATKQKLQDIDQTELNRLKGIVDYRKQELSFLIASGKSEDEINAKRKEIQASLHDQAEEMRRILAVMKEQGASEEEIRAYETSILALSTEWWNIQKEIEDSLEKQKKLQQEMFETVKKTVDDYYAKILTDKQEELSLEEKILAVQKAQADLANAQKERTVRYYNAATGQWEWRANAKTVKSAEDALKKAQDDLAKYQKDQAWKAFKDAWEYVSDQIKAGAMTFKEAYDYMYNAMREIQDTYGVDLGFVLEDSIGGFKDLNYGIDGLTQEVADTLGASVGILNEKLKEYEKAVGAFKNAFDQASEKVKNGEMSMEDAYSYLRDRAREIADKYGIDMTGALEEAIAGMDKTNMSIDELWKSVIINLMKVNSARWFDANEEERAYLHAQNEYLGSLIGATYDPSGYWYLNGSQLYGSQKGVDVSGKSGYGESTGGGSSGGGSGSSGGAGNSGIRGAAGTGKYYDSYGNEYDTLDEAVAGNAANAGGGGSTDGKPLYKGTGFLANSGKSGQITIGIISGQYVYDAEGVYHDLNDGHYFKSSNGYIYNMDTATDYELAVHGKMRDMKGRVTNIPEGVYIDWDKLEADHMAQFGITSEPPESDEETTYDSGGILRGVGGIKATARDEFILPPDITAKMMDPLNNDLSRMGLDTVRNLFGMLEGIPQPIDQSIGAQYNGDTYTMNGVTIGEQAAKTTTVYELARMAGNLGQYKGEN